MHLIERYSLSCGLPISEPFIYEKYFPLPIERYITIHPFSKPAKSYDYWQDVVDDLIPHLEKEGIRIVQIGAKDEPKLVNCIHLQGATNLGQVAYILGRSMLHLSVDTFSAHFASHKNLPMVTLFSTSYVSNCCGYWGDKSKQVFLEPIRVNGQKPSFSYDENPKSINTIPSEKISQSVLDLLGIKESIKYRTIYVGDKYKNGVYFHNIIPSQTPPVVAQDGLEIRMDLNFDTQFLVKQLQLGSCAIITDKPIDLNLIKDFKPKISMVFVIVSDGSCADFIKSLTSLGIRNEIISYETNEENVAAIRLAYYEQKKVEVLPAVSPTLIEKLSSLTNLHYKSNKIYQCGTQKFYSVTRDEVEKKIKARTVENVTKYLPLSLGITDMKDADFFKVVQEVS